MDSVLLPSVLMETAGSDFRFIPWVLFMGVILLVCVSTHIVITLGSYFICNPRSIFVRGKIIFIINPKLIV